MCSLAFLARRSLGLRLGCAAQTLAAALCFFLFVLPAAAQTYNGRILGTVTDQSGAVVVGANIDVTDVQRGTTRSTVSGVAGDYAIPSVPPGVYKVSVRAKNFRSVERVNVQVEVAQDARVDFSLQPGQATETVVVTGEVPLINTTSSTLGGTLSNKQINDLPLNGRNYENLLQLRPGVMRYPGGGFSTTSANGLRAEDNAYIIDGLFNSEPFSGQSIINGAGIAGDSATILPIDSIQEFNLQQQPPAEYGWKPGAIVNVAVKSGTNGFHGSAYAFGRDTPFDARNYFNPAPLPKTERNLEQFGGSIGGPIIKDKLFFFGAYEGQRYSVGNAFQVPSPATVSLGGDAANSAIDAIAALQAAHIAVSPVSLAISGCSLGPPISCNGKGFPSNNGLNPAGSSTINNGFPNTVSSDNAVGKIDYQMNERHTITGMYFFGNNSGTVEDFPELQPQWLTEIHTRAQVFGLTWTWVPSSKWVNQARFGFNRLFQPTFTADHNIPASQLGINTGVTNPLYGGLPRISIEGFQTLGGFNWPKVQGPDQRWQFVDHVSYITGKHAFKFGGELHRDTFTGGAYGGVRGRIFFGGVDAFPGATALEDFYAGVPSQGTLLIGNPTRHIGNWGIADFVQDDWRISRNITLNLGLRYELNTVVKDENNQLANFDPNVGLVQVGKQISSPYQGNHHNFAPRIGIAWDPTGSGNTVIRGGFGMIYETLNWESFLALNNRLGISSIPTGGIGVLPGGGNIAVGNITFDGSKLNYTPTGPVFPTGTINCSPNAPGNPCTILGMDPHLTTPYVLNWNLNVQHSITPNLSFEVAYVGNHGANLVGIHDINQPPPGAGWAPGAIAAGAPDPVAEQNARPFNAKFPFLATIYQMGNIYKSNYNGLQTTLSARNYHGFSFVAGYTYSHSLDDVGANWDFGYGSGLPMNHANPGLEYASSDFDIRHRFTLSLTYLVPGKKSFGQLLEGWELNSIVTLNSAQPWGPMDLGTDVSGTGEFTDRWNFFGSPSDFTSGPNGIPYFAATSNPACVARATAMGSLNSLGLFGCYANGNSILIPPALGQFAISGRNIFRDSGFRNWDLSVAKNWRLTERFRAQFRAEFFNVLNHTNFANPYGGQNGFGFNDPSVFSNTFGCGCATPDGAASNPVIGSGGNRSMQLGLKLIF